MQQGTLIRVEQDRARARRAVEDRRLALKLNFAELARRSGLAVNTLRDFVYQSTWPQKQSRAALETALGWPVGAIDDIANGGEVPVTRLADTTPSQVATGDHSSADGIPVSELSKLVPLLPEGWSDGMSPSEAAEALAAGLREVLAVARQIRQDRARADESTR